MFPVFAIHGGHVVKKKSSIIVFPVARVENKLSVFPSVSITVKSTAWAEAPTAINTAKIDE